MIPFLKYKSLYFLISFIVITAGLVSILFKGFVFSIDFVGGSVIEYKVDKEVNIQKVRDLFAENKIKVVVLQQPEEKQIYIKTEPIDQKKELNIRISLQDKQKIKVELLRFETVGPVIGKETMYKTGIASLVALLGILLYMTFAFKKVTYGVAAILAMIHDFLVVVGTYSLFSVFFGAEIDTLFVTALLTTMSFSVHDTIVVFDKIREYRKYDTITPIDIIANRAFTETIVRSLNNSLTIMLMLLALVLLGGDTIRFFALTLLVGTITGTYSSPFIATPLLALFERRKK